MKRPSPDARCWICGATAYDAANRDDWCSRCEAATWIEPEIVFRGCMWDDGWEFDAPCVLYSPFKRYEAGANTGAIDSMVENLCDAISARSRPEGGASASLGATETKRTLISKCRAFAPRGAMSRARVGGRSATSPLSDEVAPVEWVRVGERFGLKGPWEVSDEVR